MSIGKRLLAANGVMALIVIVIALGLSRNIASIEREFREMEERTLKITRLLEEIRFAGLRIVSSTSEYLLLEVGEHHIEQKSPDTGDSADTELELIESGINSLNENTRQYGELVEVFFPDETVYLESITRLNAELVGLTRKLTRPAAGELDFQAVFETKEKFEIVEREFLATVDQAIEHELREFRERSGEIQNEISQSENLVLLGLLGTAAFVLVFGALVARSITTPLDQLSAAVKTLRDGRYSVRASIDSNDEVGRLANDFNAMARQLKESHQLREEFVEELERSNTELERFSYTVSHELKTPLVTIKGFLGFLQKDLAAGDMEKAREDIAQVIEASDSMGRMLDDLLHLSRVGKTVRPFETFSLTGVTAEVINLLQGLAQEYDATIDYQTDMPEVYGDPQRIRVVLQNLLENSIKFSGDQRPVIRVEARQQDGKIHCSVEDNGTGIDPVYHEKVFGLFDRLDTKVDGTGIGLAVTRRVVELHGGNIWINSDGSGQGTTITFSLPAGRAADTGKTAP